MIRWKRSWPDLPEDLPVDVLPASNGEFVPLPPSPEQKAIMALADGATEDVRRKFNMSRRDFVRTTAAMTIGFWAINQVRGGKFGEYSFAKSADACDLRFEGGHAQLHNLPGEFIFDVQSHHVESDGMWRVTNPAFEAFFAAIWSQAAPLGGNPTSDGTPDPNHLRGFGIGGDVDPIENLSRYHYLKELFLDSSTTMTVLSAVPAAPDLTQPLPIDRAALTVETVRNLARSARTVMHAFVMPNRGSGGTTASFIGQDPIYMQEEFDIMEERAALYKDILRGWKVYTAWGDVPYSTGWYFDDPIGEKFLARVVELSAKYPTMPPNVAVHKGFALPAFDQRAASPRDVGPAARNNPGVNFIIYHSGYDGAKQTLYPGDDAVNSSDRDTNSLIKSLRENGIIARKYAKSYTKFGNVPNVYAEIGSTWRSVMGSPDEAAALLSKLIIHVGPERICWGTDSLWFGSPQSEIVAFRAFNFTQAGLQKYFRDLGMPISDAGMDSDYEIPELSALDADSYRPGSATFPANRPADWPTDAKPHPDRTIRNQAFGRTAARVYSSPAHKIDPDALIAENGMIACDDVQKIRDSYILNQQTPKEMVPLASNQIHGPRTAAELFKQRASQPWAP